MTGKEAHEHLKHVAAAGGNEGWSEGQEGEVSRARIWSELSTEVDAHPRGEKLPTALAKQINEAFPPEAAAPAEEPKG